MPTPAAEIMAKYGVVLPVSPKDRPIDYIDPAPKPFVVQVPLVEYFERIKRLKADRWQHHFCNYLQNAVANRHLKATWAEFHAEAQLGKTTILSQAFKAWCLGHDPLWRAVLAMYNSSRSETHSDVVIQIMRSSMHLDIFPNKDSHLPSNVSKDGWSTNARRQLNDGQKSFNPVGLQSGITGSGFDWLTIDDPYKEPKDAFSETVRDNLARFWEYGVDPRLNPYSCIAAMFHRYSPDDFGGYLLNTGKFDYIRYATVADGPYVHDETGQRFNDPLGRVDGEYISPDRRPASYYEDKRKNKQVWLSMFQGRPSSEEGEFFNISNLPILTPEDTAIRRQECTIIVRAWDGAATEDGGDYSVGSEMGMSADGRVTIFGGVRAQVESAGRDELQLKTAKRDGLSTVITFPDDPGAAGKTAVYHVQQLLKGFTVSPRSTSGSKEDRARSFASAVNSGKVSFGSDIGDDFYKEAKKELRNFPLSDHDDIVDSCADGYNECYERMSKGLVIKSFGQNNLVTWQQFKDVYGLKIPKDWQVYAGVKVTPDSSTPNSAVIIARSSQLSEIDALFIIAEYKEYTADFHDLFEWLKKALVYFCEANPKIIFLHKDSESFKPTIQQKLGYGVRIFKGDVLDGITELNWHLRPTDGKSPFNAIEKASRLYGLVTDAQQMTALDADGLYNVRQESSTWGFDDKQRPNAIGGVLDCLRMITYQFRPQATQMTTEQRIAQAIPMAVRETLKTAKTSSEKMVALLDYEFQRDIAEQTIYPHRQEEEWE